jgi:Grx4 family monothiol glutaredoxin
MATVQAYDENGSAQLPTTRSVLFFWANWHEPSKSGGQMDVVVNELASQYSNISFLKIEAEVCPIISSKYDIEVVPTFIFLNDNGEIQKKVEGVNPPEVASQTSLLAGIPSSKNSASGGGSDSSLPLEDRLVKLINASPVVLFMKGSVSEPRCKFSRQMVEILQEEKVQFGTFDILGDEEVRQGLKSFSNWPTYPQLYVKGELIGGIDVVKEMQESGSSLITELGLEVTDLSVNPTSSSSSNTSSLEDRLKQLIGSSKVMLFMKGSPEEPRCGFSRKIVKILKDEGFVFSTFDILTDEEVRQGLKDYSSWPTFPQLYIDSEFVGGLDIVEEMRNAGELKDMKPTN